MKIERIFLIHPPGNRVKRNNGERGLKAAVPPLGLAYLAAALRAKRYEVAILDCIAEGYNEAEIEVEPEIFRYGLSDEEIKAAIQSFKPDIIGISCPQTVRQPEANCVASICKEVFPDIPVVMGGASPSALKQEIMQNANIDFILQGEGEERFCELLEALHHSSLTSLSKVDGLIYREGKSIVINDHKKAIAEIDTLPLPAYDLLPMDKYFSIQKNPSVLSGFKNTSIMISSRGCAMKCYYCPVHNVFGPRGPFFRMRDIDSVLSEIEFLVTRYNVKEIQFEDANFNASIERTITLSNAIGKRFPDLRWCAPHGNQISTLSDRVLDAMREGGCQSIYLAIESGNQYFLNKHKNSVKLAKLKTILEKARNLDFKINAFFMIGYPEETREDMHNTINFALSLDLDGIHFFIATPFPGTGMYEMCKENGWLISESSWRHFRYSMGVIKTRNFDPAYLQKVRREAWLRLQDRIKRGKSLSDLNKMESEMYG
jgi:magnesium-protoporphyrin IX monomethyl ester (oxidative) cyclase